MDATAEFMHLDGLPLYVMDRDAVREVDRRAIEDAGIPGIVLMENAARGLTVAVLDMLAGNDIHQSHVIIVCGSGNNGGDGYALARHLHNASVNVTIVAMGEPKPESDAGTNAAICTKMGLAHVSARSADFNSATLIVDAIFGTGLDRPIEGTAASIIEEINESNRPVLAVDIPSGLEADTGQPQGYTIQAHLTVTFVAVKKGFLNKQARLLTGDVCVAGIGAPREIVESLGTPLATMMSHE